MLAQNVVERMEAKGKENGCRRDGRRERFGCECWGWAFVRNSATWQWDEGKHGTFPLDIHSRAEQNQQKQNGQKRVGRRRGTGTGTVNTPLPPAKTRQDKIGTRAGSWRQQPALHLPSQCQPTRRAGVEPPVRVVQGTTTISAGTEGHEGGKGGGGLAHWDGIQYRHWQRHERTDRERVGETGSRDGRRGIEDKARAGVPCTLRRYTSYTTLHGTDRHARKEGALLW